MASSCIYKIVNILNGKFYIGSTFDADKRFYQHKNDLNRNCHENSHLQNSWNAHGEKVFKFMIVELCEREKLIEREQHWIDTTDCCNFNVGYNSRKIANSNLGLKHSQNTCAKMSISAKGRLHSEETKFKMSVGIRRVTKWPCSLGSYCRCRLCREKKNEYNRNWRKKNYEKENSNAGGKPLPSC